jgi:hypothetical protein
VDGLLTELQTMAADAAALAAAADVRRVQGTFSREVLGFEAGATGVVTNGRAFVSTAADGTPVQELVAGDFAVLHRFAENYQPGGAMGLLYGCCCCMWT